MCGRFTRTVDIKSIKDMFKADMLETDLAVSYNIAPRQPIVVVMEKGVRKVVSMQWGLIPHWAKDEKIASKLINARSETITEKPSFANSFKKKRCLIVADGFFEWKTKGKSKIPQYIYLKDRSPFAMAGLYDLWTNPQGQTIATCTIITTAANEFMKDIHHRMPMIIPPESYDLWLDPTISALTKLNQILKPYDGNLMATHTVSVAVNSPVNNDENCIKPE